MSLPRLRICNESLAIAKFSDMDAVSALAGSFFSLTCTAQEISLVCEVDALPANAISVSKIWRCLEVVGPLDFALTGILSPIAKILAEANIAIFAISSYDTDFVLVREEMLAAACEALQAAGYEITRNV